MQILYSISACVYTGIIFGIQSYSSSHSLFVADSNYGKIFAILAVLSWAVVGFGAFTLIVLYFPSKSKNAPGLAETSIPLLLVIACCLLFVAVGMLMVSAAAGIVFAGSRERYKTYARGSTVEAWLLPVVTGIIPAVLFLLAGLSVVGSFLGTMRDMRGPKRRVQPVDDSLTSEVENSGGAVDGTMFAGSAGAPQHNPQNLDPHQEGLVQNLMAQGYHNRAAVIAALQASSWNVRGAEVRLANTQHVPN
jgi:hypothetical protein